MQTVLSLRLIDLHFRQFAMSGFIKTIRNSKNAFEMLKRRPTAFLLLYIIAQRARRSNENNFDELELGEAKVGDYKSYKTSETIYKNDKNFLERYHFATFKGTSMGTIAKLIDTSIFDINSDITDEQQIQQGTNKERTRNEQGTTNKNVKNVKNDKNREYRHDDVTQLPEENKNSHIKILDDPLVLSELDKNFPKIDTLNEIAKMKDWLTAKGKKQKDYVAFARNWLRRAQAQLNLNTRNNYSLPVTARKPRPKSEDEILQEMREEGGI